MCQDCGCSITPEVEEHHPHEHKHTTIHANPQLNDTKTIDVISKILAKNDHEAQHNREHFDKHGVLALNLMSSPGSGKTTLLEKTADLGGLKFGVIEGDLETNRDADRLKAKGIEAFQITTGTACHLDAFMVHKGLHHMPLDTMDICFVENVGNLVCPAEFDIGEDARVVILSVTEGEDKPLKYPLMFRECDVAILNKTDLLPYLDFDMAEAVKNIRQIHPDMPIIEMSSKTQEGMAPWLEWLQQQVEKKQQV